MSTRERLSGGSSAHEPALWCRLLNYEASSEQRDAPRRGSTVLLSNHCFESSSPGSCRALLDVPLARTPPRAGSRRRAERRGWQLLDDDQAAVD